MIEIYEHCLLQMMNSLHVSLVANQIDCSYHAYLSSFTLSNNFPSIFISSFPFPLVFIFLFHSQGRGVISLFWHFLSALSIPFNPTAFWVSNVPAVLSSESFFNLRARLLAALLLLHHRGLPVFPFFQAHHLHQRHRYLYAIKSFATI